MTAPAPAAANIAHDGQARLFAPSELRIPQRAPEPKAPTVVAYSPGREVFIAETLGGDPDRYGRRRTLYGAPLKAVVAALAELAPGPRSSIAVEDARLISKAEGVLAFYVPDERRKRVLFALADGLTVEEARAELRAA